MATNKHVVIAYSRLLLCAILIGELKRDDKGAEASLPTYLIWSLINRILEMINFKVRLKQNNYNAVVFSALSKDRNSNEMDLQPFAGFTLRRRLFSYNS